MYTKFSSSPLPLALLLFALLTLQSCSSSDDTAENREDEIQVIPVEVSYVSRGDISAYYSNTATLDAEQEATVVSKVRGIIETLYIEEGARVQAGQVIAKIEDDQYRIELNRAKATLDRLESEYQRNNNLFERDLI